MSKGYKGGDYEREVCKRLSLWWTSNQRDDVYWRSSQSGGRATQRMKSGKSTYGSYGDIAAVDPIGEPLLKLFTIELKRGSSYSSPGDLLDFGRKNAKHPWMKCLIQAQEAAVRANTWGWMIICRRDRREGMVCVSSTVFRHMANRDKVEPRARIILPIHMRTTADFVVTTLDSFLSRISPGEIVWVLKYLEKYEK